VPLLRPWSVSATMIVMWGKAAWIGCPMALILAMVGCSGSHASTSGSTTSPVVAQCPPEPANVPISAFVEDLGGSNQSFHTQVGSYVIVRTPNGDRDGKAWRLAVTKGSARLCIADTPSRDGSLAPPSIAEFRTIAAGTVVIVGTRTTGQSAHITLTVS
jgi:hypothetical protein